jgi:K+-transporting ATPase ATPase B chain
MSQKSLAMFDPALIAPALVESFYKLDPRVQLRNPVMFVVYVGSLFTTWLWFQALAGHGEAPAWFIGTITLWLWFTVLFANFAEAIEAAARHRPRRCAAPADGARPEITRTALRRASGLFGSELRRGDVVLVRAAT